MSLDQKASCRANLGMLTRLTRDALIEALNDNDLDWAVYLVVTDFPMSTRTLTVTRRSAVPVGSPIGVRVGLMVDMPGMWEITGRQVVCATFSMRPTSNLARVTLPGIGTVTVL